MITLGLRVYGIAAILLGLVGLAFGDFASVWQPVPAGFPYRLDLAYATGVAFILGGLTLNWRRTAPFGAVLLTALYSLCIVLLHIPIAVAQPQVFVNWSGIAEQLALVAAGVVACAAVFPIGTIASHRLARAGQVVFALCLLVFGAAHFVYLSFTAVAVPKVLPLGGVFWARATGAAHIAAGLAILFGIRARLAAYLLTAMFVGFGVLVHAPTLIAAPFDHFGWAANAINLALIGAAWTMADSIARRPRPAATP